MPCHLSTPHQCAIHCNSMSVPVWWNSCHVNVMNWVTLVFILWHTFISWYINFNDIILWRKELTLLHTILVIVDLFLCPTSSHSSVSSLPAILPGVDARNGMLLILLPRRAFYTKIPSKNPSYLVDYRSSLHHWGPIEATKRYNMCDPVQLTQHQHSNGTAWCFAWCHTHAHMRTQFTLNSTIYCWLENSFFCLYSHMVVGKNKDQCHHSNMLINKCRDIKDV